MDTKTTSIVAYLTIIGTIAAFCFGDKEGAKFHINQALVIWLFYLFGRFLLFFATIPLIGFIFAFFTSFIGTIFLFVCWCIGLTAAIKQEETSVPLIGGITLIK